MSDLKLPPILTKLVCEHDAWFSGTAAEPTSDISTLKSIAVCVPTKHWDNAKRLLPADATPVWRAAGFKFTDGDVRVDMTPGNLIAFVGRAIKNRLPEGIQYYAWHPISNVRIQA